MVMFVAILALEVWPMTTLIRWRMGKAEPHARDVGRIEVISYIECALVIGMVLAAVSMARGIGVMAATPPVATSRGHADSLVAHGDVVAAALIVADSGPNAIGRETAPVASANDADLLIHEITMPLAGVDPMTL